MSILNIGDRVYLSLDERKPTCTVIACFEEDFTYTVQESQEDSDVPTLNELSKVD